MIQHQKIVVILLRISIASVFIYAAVGSILQPDNWISFVPSYLTTNISAQLVLLGLAIFQILLSIWLLIGKKTFYAASLAAVMLLGIIVTNMNVLDIVFRDFAIFFAAVALAVASDPTS